MGREPKNFRLLFSDDMARAIVQGRKTVTRRPIAPQPVIPPDVGQHLAPGETLSMLVNESWQSGFVDVRAPCAPGDILIGRECTRTCTAGVGNDWTEYRADGTEPRQDRVYVSRWRPSIHMPDWAARIRRRVVSVTVERLQDISEVDAVREGFSVGEDWEMFGASTRFCAVWNSIYAAKGLGWHINPWVWRIEFSAQNDPAA